MYRRRPGAYKTDGPGFFRLRYIITRQVVHEPRHKFHSAFQRLFRFLCKRVFSFDLEEYVPEWESSYMLDYPT